MERLSSTSKLNPRCLKGEEVSFEPVFPLNYLDGAESEEGPSYWECYLICCLTLMVFILFLTLMVYSFKRPTRRSKEP